MAKKDKKEPEQEPGTKLEQVLSALSELHEVYFGLDADVTRQRLRVDEKLGWLMAMYDAYLN